MPQQRYPKPRIPSQLNPQLSQRRRVADLIAKQRGIKIKSAMRYLQRASAPVGKQRIKQPTYYGLSDYARRKAVQDVHSVLIRREKERRGYTGDYFEDLKLLGESVRRGDTVFKKKVFPPGQLEDRVAALSGLLGSLDDAADILDTDFELIEKVVLSLPLNILEIAEINEQYFHLFRDTETQTDFDIDINEVERRAAIVSDTIKNIDDIDVSRILRQIIAENEIDWGAFENGSHRFRDFTRHQAKMILQEWLERHGTNEELDLTEAFVLLANDGNKFYDMEDSEFWAWFREIFYPEDD